MSREGYILRFGITGHMDLTTEAGPLVYQAITDVLAPYASDDLVGVSCIARGADSVFARVVLEFGGKLEVVIPASAYRDQKVKPDDQPEFDELMRQATSIRTMPFAAASRAAYEAANETLVSSCDTLIAVWDGQDAADRGGTGSVVEYARAHGVPVEVVCPEGARRGEVHHGRLPAKGAAAH